MGTAETLRQPHGNRGEVHGISRRYGVNTYGVTLGMGTAISGNTAEICPYIHLRINFVLFDWTYARGQMNKAVSRLC